MQPLLNECTRRAAGAYRATPIRSLELETYTPPLDIYLNKRLADFELRLKGTGMTEKINEACAGVRHRLRNLRGRPRIKRHPEEGHEAWAEEWAPLPPPRPQRPLRPGQKVPKEPSRTELALARDWKARWEESRMGKDPKEAADVPNKDAFTKGAHLRLYEKGYKAQTSVIIQMRTGKIGLSAFLYYRKVPGQLTPACDCGRIQTVGHLLTECVEPRSQPLRALGDRKVHRRTTSAGSDEAARNSKQDGSGHTSFRVAAQVPPCRRVPEGNRGGRKAAEVKPRPGARQPSASGNKT